MSLHRIDRARSHRICGKIDKVVHRSGGRTRNCQAALERWIADQIATRSPATWSECMVNTAHSSQYRLARSSEIPGKTDTWLPVNRLLFSEALGNGWISTLNDSIELITGIFNESTDQAGICIECSSHRIPSPSIFRVTSRANCWSRAVAERLPNGRRLRWIPARRIET